MQASEWWARVMINLIKENLRTINITQFSVISSMMPDGNKNSCIEEKQIAPLTELEQSKNRLNLTDANRVVIADGFMKEKDSAEWLFSIDDDTTPPPGAIAHLIALGRPFVSGLYFNARKPHAPIAYMRNELGYYESIYNYPRGALLQVDAVGMGCTLIHRSVFEKIKAEHVVYKRPNGSVTCVHKSKILDNKTYKGKNQKDTFVQDGLLQTPIHPQPEDDLLPFPYFSLEYMRTEDLWFCELAANVGIRPWVDTNIVCEHWKMKPVTYSHYQDELKKMDREEDQKWISTN